MNDAKILFLHKDPMLYRIDLILYDMLGSSKFVINWWHTPNPNFNGETPMAVYLSSEDGPDIVMNYAKRVIEDRKKKYDR